MFDAIDAHPWVGTQLAREPWHSPMARIFESVGLQLEAMGVSEHDQFYCASAIVNYVLGVAGQYAAAARGLGTHTDRSAFLANVAEQWAENAPGDSSFLRRMAARLSEHDEREQFLTGIDLILGGLTVRG